MITQFVWLSTLGVLLTQVGLAIHVWQHDQQIKRHYKVLLGICSTLAEKGILPK